jgi:L-glyceraldehyde 3-phosphate reductase
VVLGASSVAQLDENLDALANLDFTGDELKRIDAFASEGHVDLWREVAEN